MRHLAKYLLILLTTTIVAGSEHPAEVSLVQLLASPGPFEGRLVMVKGYLRIGREPHHPPETTLFLDREDAENLLDNAVPVQPTDAMLRDSEKYDRMYVLLTGRVRVSGSDTPPRVALLEATSCVVWSDPGRPLGKQPKKKEKSGK